MQPAFTIQGHRGYRGKYPENTLISFKKAIEVGCKIIELDVVVNGKNQILVSHDPFLNHEICLDKNGKAIPAVEERFYNLYKMGINEISIFDCGTKTHKRFPQQQSIKCSKPLLKDLVKALDKIDNSIIYNIEVKSEKEWYGEFQPLPEEYVSILLNEINELRIANRCYVQSFDPKIIELVHQKQPEIITAFIVGYNSFEENMQRINYVPRVYCAHYSLVTPQLKKKVHNAGMQLFVWTVNKQPVMDRILKLGVDSIITDYPQKLMGRPLAILQKNNFS